MVLSERLRTPNAPFLLALSCELREEAELFKRSASPCSTRNIESSNVQTRCMRPQRTTEPHCFASSELCWSRRVVTHHRAPASCAFRAPRTPSSFVQYWYTMLRRGCLQLARLAASAARQGELCAPSSTQMVGATFTRRIHLLSQIDGVLLFDQIPGIMLNAGP